MKNDEIKKIAHACYSKRELDLQKVKSVANKLSRKELKKFIQALRHIEDRRMVIVTTPNDLSAAEKKQFADRFPQKRLEFIADPSIITGVRIEQGDVIFEDNLESTLDDMVTSVAQMYE